jgi:SAM-dependent methyltransferase
MHILDNPRIWQFFRGLLEHVFCQYSKRIAIIRSFGITDQMSVLDVGCGTGQFTKLTQGRYLGIDMNKGYIDQAKKIYKNEASKEFLCEDLGKAKLPESAFDVSLLIDFTHHLSDHELNNVFLELNRVTSQYIVISDPVKQSAKNLLGRVLTYLDRGKYIRAEDELISLIGSYFQVLEIKKARGMGIEGVSVLSCPKK